MALVLHRTMGCWPRGAGKIPASIEVPWVTLSAQESSRVRPVSLSSQAREKVTTVPGWESHGAMCAHHGDRTGTGCCSSALQEQHPQLLGLSVMPCCVPCPHLVLGSVSKAFSPCPSPDSISLQSCWVCSTWDEGVGLCSRSWELQSLSVSSCFSEVN